MLELTKKELEKLISTLKWVQVATLSTKEEEDMIQNLIDKMLIAKKTASSSRVKFEIK